MQRYFDKLRDTQGIELTPAQKAWYVKKAGTQLCDMKREYPSTPEEAFEASLEGAYYADQLAAAELQGRVGEFPAEPGVPVDTAWDIGIGDYTSIWFFQRLARPHPACALPAGLRRGLAALRHRAVTAARAARLDVGRGVLAA